MITDASPHRFKIWAISWHVLSMTARQRFRMQHGNTMLRAKHSLD
jgi:hypothetical protein